VITNGTCVSAVAPAAASEEFLRNCRRDRGFTDAVEGIAESFIIF